jgi:hypothetical protein
MSQALDISNWGGPLGADTVAQWRGDGYDLVLVGVDLRSQNIALAKQQLTAISEGGLAVGAYREAYWGTDVEANLAQVASVVEVFKPEVIGLAFEDDNAPLGGYSSAELVCAWIRSYLDVADRIWGRDRVCIYTAPWWWNPWTNRTARFSDRMLWVADYDGAANLDFTPFGGWSPPCAIKQFRNSVLVRNYSVDVNYYEEEGMTNKELEAKIARQALLERWAGLILTAEDALVEKARAEMNYIALLAAGGSG